MTEEIIHIHWILHSQMDEGIKYDQNARASARSKNYYEKSVRHTDEGFIFIVEELEGE